MFVSRVLWFSYPQEHTAFQHCWDRPHSDRSPCPHPNQACLWTNSLTYSKPEAVVPVRSHTEHSKTSTLVRIKQLSQSPWLPVEWTDAQTGHTESTQPQTDAYWTCCMSQSEACLLSVRKWKAERQVVFSLQMQLAWNYRVHLSTLWEKEAFQEHGWCVVWESEWSASLKPTRRGSSHRKGVPLFELDSVDSSSVSSARLCSLSFIHLGAGSVIWCRSLASIGFMYAQGFGQPPKEHCTNLGNCCRVKWHYYLEYSQNRYRRSWEEGSIGKTLAVDVWSQWCTPAQRPWRWKGPQGWLAR